MSEIIAAVVSVVGSACLGLSGFVYRKYCIKFEKRELKKQIKTLSSHELFNLTYQHEIVCEYDNIRSLFFKDIQTELLYEITKQNINELLKKIKETGKEIDSYSTMEMYVLLRDFQDKLIDDQESYINKIPSKLQQIVNKLISPFKDALSKAIDLVHTDSNNYSILLQLLNVCTVIIHLIGSEWASIANQINGQLSGQLWKNHRIGYVYTGTNESLISRFIQINNFVEKIDPKCASCIVDDSFLLKDVSDNFLKLTKYDKTDLINRNCNILQSNEMSNLNIHSNMKFKENLMNYENSFVIFHQQTKLNDDFLFYTYAASIRVLFNNNIKLFNISVQQYSDDINNYNNKMYNEILHTRMGFVISAVLADYEFITINDFTVSSMNRFIIKYLHVGKSNPFRIQSNENITSVLNITRKDIDYVYEKCISVNSDLLNTSIIHYTQDCKMYMGESWFFNGHLIIIHRLKK